MSDSVALITVNNLNYSFEGIIHNLYIKHKDSNRFLYIMYNELNENNG